MVAFIQCLRRELAAAGPILVVLPPASLAFWEGEFAFWAGQDANVVSFAGTPAARAVVREHELWLTPASMDGRSTFNVHGTLPAKVRHHSSTNPWPIVPQAVLISQRTQEHNFASSLTSQEHVRL